MNMCGILSAFYYIGNTGFNYKSIPNFVENINQANDNIDFCSTDNLSKLLDNINTRLIDIQSLSLEAAIKVAEDENLFIDINKDELSIIAGSYSSAIYPHAKFILSAKEKGPNFVNATEFTNIVGNAAVSRACIWNQFRGEAFAISEGLNSGLNAVVDAYNNIKYRGTKDTLACATEEIGSSAILIKNVNAAKTTHKPIAYIKNCDSNYISNINELESYLYSLNHKFNIDLKDVDIYLSGDFNKVNYLSTKLKSKNINIQKTLNKNMWSITPLIDLGRALYNYDNGFTKDCIIISLDINGFVSSVHITKGEHE